MEILIIVICVLLFVAGFIGCVAPSIPGPPLCYSALLLLHFAYKSLDFSTRFLVILGAVTVLVWLLDYVLPLLSAKMYGVSKQGMIGSFIGMFLGIILLPPFGMMFGILTGAIVGELIAGKEHSQALKAGLVTFMANITAMFIKLSLCALMLFFFIQKLL